MLRVDDHFDDRGVLVRTVGSAVGVENNFDFLDAVVIFGQFVGLLLRIVFDRGSQFHVPRRNDDVHARILPLIP